VSTAAVSVKPCPLCGSTRHEVVYPSTLQDCSPTSDDFRCTSIAYGEHGDIGRCLECGLVYILDPSTDESISAAYADVEDPEYVVGHEARIATFERQLGRLERFAPRGDLLEVGAYTGVFLSLAKARGWQVQGIEPSRWACERAAEEHGLEVRNGPFAPGVYDPESMDAVVMWDVIEHLPDPLGATREAFRILRPGGWVALSTMDIGSLAARISRGRWPWLMSMHLEYFSRATMRRMLEAAGFADIRFVTHIRTIRLHYLGDRMATRIPVLGATVRWIGGLPGFSRVVVPFTIGDLFEVYARKPLAAAGAEARPAS
jgi:SAM-dependent methyltransferase